jgi:uncharacterized protein YjiS (DUF1127 family)
MTDLSPLAETQRLAGLLEPLLALPARGLRAACRAWRATLAEEHLNELDDRLLRDIGLRRDEIGRRVRGRAAGRLPDLSSDRSADRR